MGFFSNPERKWALFMLIPTAAVTIFTGTVTHFLTKGSTEAAVKAGIVEVLSDHFDFVDTTMAFEDALAELYNNNEMLESSIADMSDEAEKLESENAQLRKEIAKQPSVAFSSPDIINDGLKESAIKNSVLAYNASIFYSQSLIDHLLLDKTIYYNADENEVIFNSGNNSFSGETLIRLMDTTVLYDGKYYRTYSPSASDSFSMGGKEYSNGFQIWDDHSLFGDGDGYALFNLGKEYSSISFTVGRTNITDNKEDATLKVYLNGEYQPNKDVELSSEANPKEVTIDLEYADSLKIEIAGGSKVGYGFANPVLHF